ncbi:hypothetical protein TSUD_172960 [Trifolium subterraneum]|nr:hypothetical protein TSUD_172960 [Trifolium subterraneum]
MATVAESSEPETPPPAVNLPTITTTTAQTQPQTLDVQPFIDYAVGQALFYQKTFNDAVDSAIEVSTSRFSQIRSTSSAHFQQTLHYLDEFKSQYNAYEDLLFGKIKGPRRIMYYNAKRLFFSEESLISKASAEVIELRKSIDLLKSEVEKMEVT